MDTEIIADHNSVYLLGLMLHVVFPLLPPCDPSHVYAAVQHWLHVTVVGSSPLMSPCYFCPNYLSLGQTELAHRFRIYQPAEAMS